MRACDDARQVDLKKMCKKKMQNKICTCDDTLGGESYAALRSAQDPIKRPIMRFYLYWNLCGP
jgi:hypothetical protein